MVSSADTKTYTAVYVNAWTPCWQQNKQGEEKAMLLSAQTKDAALRGSSLDSKKERNAYGTEYDRISGGTAPSGGLPV